MERWFDTGLVMKDGKTKRVVLADSEIKSEEFTVKGWKPVRKKRVTGKKVLLRKASEVSGRKDDAGAGR